MLSIWVQIFAVFNVLRTCIASSQTLAGYVSSDGILHADDKILTDTFGGARDYTAIVLFTSNSDRLDCQFCRVLGPNFQQVAESYDSQLKENADLERKLFFILADVDNCMGTLKKLGMAHIPNVAIYEPTRSKSEAKKGILAPTRFISFTNAGDQTAYLLKTLGQLGFPITLKKPFPILLVIKTLATLSAVAVGVYVFWSKLIKVWQAKQLWLALSLMSIIMFISGHMFNVTRGAPFMGFDGANMLLVEPSFSSQVAVETQILAVVYALLSFTTIGLLKFVPRLETRSAQTVGAIFGAVAIFIVYSILLEIFQVKMSGFPMRLLHLQIRN